MLSRLRDHEAIVADLRTTLSHLDATLFHLGHYPDGEPAPKKPMAAGLFYHGELPRLILRMLRQHPKGLGLKTMVEMMNAQKGWAGDDERFNRELRLKISRTLDRKRLKGIVERIGEDAIGVWRLVPLAED
ncbi:hypothetical protein [Parvularcula lutaonensis]|uniref:DUF2285 domain-containing protein n=1 Tax=Parvularcula lutaonensis TaxID=491923 RepID=A0ABV7MCP8_9PROT|nr:hypothetical protein [Parvularcula lutaonensis]